MSVAVVARAVDRKKEKRLYGVRGCDDNDGGILVVDNQIPR